MALLHPAPLLPVFASYTRRASLHPVLGWTAIPRTCRECAPLAPLPGTLPFHLRLPSSCHSSSGLIQVVALDPYSCLGSHTLGVPPQRVSEAFWLPFKWPESGFLSFVDFSHHLELLRLLLASWGSLPILLWLEARPERYFQVMGTVHHRCGSCWPGPQPRGCATQAFSDEARLCYWLWPMKHGRRDVYLFKGENLKASAQIASFSVPAKQKSCQPTLGYWKSEK